MDTNNDERLETAKSRAKVMGVLFLIPVFIISVRDDAMSLLFHAVALGVVLAGAYWLIMKWKDKRDARREEEENG
ncbi:MAG: hypothetical protein J5506_02430 [Prevotella sp.]|nr:hypothetical protein [Prevotella sp.]